MLEYQYKTVPWEHQKLVFERSRNCEYFGLFMEQRTGKTKVILDTAAFNYANGRITSLLVIAPNGVHRNWVINEIPTHMPDYVPRRVALWVSTPNKKEKQALDELFTPGPELRILCMNVEALSHKRAFEFAKKFVSLTQCLVAVDESHKMKTGGASRTKNIMKLKNLSAMRRIATGTFGESPFDLFSQMSFLDENILGTSSMTAFRAEYAELLPSNSPLVRKILAGGARYTPQIVATDALGRPKYRNLDKLQELIEPHVYRILKEDCHDLPPKIYQRVYSEMADQQAVIYHDLKKNMAAMIHDEYKEVAMRLTLITRLQEVLGGFFEKKALMPYSMNPRVLTLLDTIESSPGKMIIWCRFVHEIKQLRDAIAENYGGDSVAAVFGETHDRERARIIDEFQDRQRDADGNAIHQIQSGYQSKLRIIVANQATTGISNGQDLTRAKTVVYYSNEFKLLDRLQSEDRAHGPGLVHSVDYLDFEVPDTVDGRIIAALRSKKSVADVITGDSFKEWLA